MSAWHRDFNTLAVLGAAFACILALVAVTYSPEEKSLKLNSESDNRLARRAIFMAIATLIVTVIFSTHREIHCGMSEEGAG